MTTTVRFEDWQRHHGEPPGYVLSCSAWDGDTRLGMCSLPIDTMGLDLLVKRPTGRSPTAGHGPAVRALAEVLAEVAADAPRDVLAAEDGWIYRPNDGDLRMAGHRAAAHDRAGSTMPVEGEVIEVPE